MSSAYQPNVIESAVQDYWKSNHCFKINENAIEKEKFYCLSAFPYPSGELHVGHVRNYVLGDVIARYQRMLGKHVLHPMGWDAFGLPAENAALKKGAQPAQWTYQNIERMRAQLQRLGLSYDWDRELMTCKPNYYRWEQWFFTKLVENGLAYRKTSWVNWDPVDQTILANEQVIDGRGWRSGAQVEKRAIPQWFIKISDYAEQLLQDLEHLTEWPDAVKIMQRNWIGRSEGTLIQFKIENHSQISALEVFTTRVETLMGVSYLGIAPDHPLAQHVAQHDEHMQQFIAHCLTLPTAEASMATQKKEGYFTGLYAIHPLTQAPLPIWIANFVTMDYGTGAVMAVPAHDARDFEFAQGYHLPIQPVIEPSDDILPDYTQGAYTTASGTLIHSGEFTGLTVEKAKQAITNCLIQRQCGKPHVQYRLRDWGVSRQRYWGTPIPIIYCDQCGTLPVPEKDLPVVLPEHVEFTEAKSPLTQLETFYTTTCPQCHQTARRETDTFDTFFESSWYFIRFIDPQAAHMIPEVAPHWLPVDQYICGIEHVILHFLYARFFYKLLNDLDVLKLPKNHLAEPFKRLLTQGMVLRNGVKMSKSKHNTVDPGTLIEQYGADTIRLFSLFAAPPEQSLEWSDSGVLGAHRFLNRLWQFATTQITPHHLVLDDVSTLNEAQKQLRTALYQLLQTIHNDYKRSQFNTVISSAMKLLNTLHGAIPDVEAAPEAERLQWDALLREGISILLRVLAPLVPHITHILWQQLNFEGLILDAKWPEIDNAALQAAQQTIVVQINGKRRALFTVDSTVDMEKIKTTAMDLPAVQPYLQGKTIKKIIGVPAKTHAPLLVNIVAHPH
jgi:leucyl-tRNA synthetase